MLTFLDSLLPGPRLPSPPSPQLSWTTRVPSLPTMHENWIGPWATACSDLSRNPPSLQTGSSFGQGTLGGLAPGLHFQLNQADSLLPAPSPPAPPGCRQALACGRIPSAFLCVQDLLLCSHLKSLHLLTRDPFRILNSSMSAKTFILTRSHSQVQR